MGKEQQTPQPAVTYVDPFRDTGSLKPISAEARTLLRTVNQKIAARPSLRAIVDYLFDNTQELIPCDRMGLAFIDEQSVYVTSYYNRASYERLRIDQGYREGLRGSTLTDVMHSGLPRIINDLEAYVRDHPRSRSSKLLIEEGVRSSLTCPLIVEGRVVGFIFRSSRTPYTYGPNHIELQMAIAERLSQAVEKAWRIEQLEEANYAYTQMLGFVSHELQSPVASMVTDAQILSQGYLGDLTPEQRAKVLSMERKGQYLLSLVREYLDLAQVEGGELRLAPRSRVDVMEEVVAEAVDLVRPQADAHGIHLMTCVPSPALPPVCCDPTLLRIVTVNLLDNAIKYGDEGGDIRVKAEVTLDEKGGERLRISVWNSGPGFSHGEQNKLFRRFSRLDDPALKSRRGTGVGLYNSWRIVQLHKGRIAAESEQGQWAEFSFEIPAAADCPVPEAVDLGSSA
ncbi:MAG TPA: GAF domain-containing sensor histidine kinase [Thermoleophilia bacterium]|nr:GAF domain-containing sensor histidine kinase [Thermoleophilia bacterium]